MKDMLINAALTILLRIRWDQVLEIVWRLFERKVPAPVMAEIQSLVGTAEQLWDDGEKKGTWVRDMLQSPMYKAELQQAIREVPSHLINNAIEQAVTRLRSESDA